MNQKQLPQRVLVTGASSFLGQFVVHELKTMGLEVFQVDRRNGFNLLLETETLAAFMVSRPEIVIHLAASSGQNHSNQGTIFRDTLKMGMNVLDSTMLAGAKFVTVASKSIYSKTPFFAKSNVKVIQEALLHIGAASDAVGEARRALLAACSRYQAQYQRPYAFLVLPPLYGPGQPKCGALEEGRGIGFMANCILDLANEPEFSFSGMTSGDILDGIFIQDAAKAIVQAALELEHDGLVNLGGTPTATRGAIAKMVTDQIGYDGKIHFDEKEAGPFCALSGELAQKLMNWKPTVSLEEGVKMAVQFYSKGAEVPEAKP
jgi:GDP-L-fucose synthase